MCHEYNRIFDCLFIFESRLSRIQTFYCILLAAGLGIVGFFAPLLLLYFSGYKLEQNDLNKC